MNWMSKNISYKVITIPRKDYLREENRYYVIADIKSGRLLVMDRTLACNKEQIKLLEDTAPIVN